MIYTLSLGKIILKGQVNEFFNMHGFRHPIEAVINAVIWYPELFDNQIDNKKLIDGIVHHMYQLPVRSFKDESNNPLELRNFELVPNIPTHIKNLLISSSTRNILLQKVSFAPCLYPEGLLISKADKIVSMGQIKIKIVL